MKSTRYKLILAISYILTQVFAPYAHADALKSGEIVAFSNGSYGWYVGVVHQVMEDHNVALVQEINYPSVAGVKVISTFVNGIEWEGHGFHLVDLKKIRRRVDSIQNAYGQKSVSAFDSVQFKLSSRSHGLSDGFILYLFEKNMIAYTNTDNKPCFLVKQEACFKENIISIHLSDENSTHKNLDFY